MTYKEIVDSIIELRDQCDALFENDGENTEIKAKLDEIRSLMDSAMIEDDTQVIDKFSVYEYLADGYRDIDESKDAIDCYETAIDLGCGIADANRMLFQPLEDLYKNYIVLRYLADGNDSSDLEEDLFQHVKNGKALLKEALQYAKEISQ